MSTPNNTQLGNKSVQEKRRNSSHCPALQRGAMTETLTRITITPSDMLMFAAVAMLPFDGTKIGIPLPYWAPISPWLFTLYTIINWRYLRDTARRFLPFFLFPLLLVLTSVYGCGSHMEYTTAQPQSHSSPYC
ncbi:putative membrane spanning protein [Bifidobacterium longum subsp. longum]|nr:hypothetical protein [Bifidobacterium longum]TCF91765.1 putative membrane spanning protein [Bifidobacterium longum subsp. longum]